MATPKHRYAAFEVYPETQEGLPHDWWDILKATHGMWARSLHHGEGDEGKDHYHVMYCHGAPTTDANLRACVPDNIAANGHVEICTSPRGYMRYLIHLDDPDKEQFEDGIDHIETLNGFPLDLSKEYTADEKKRMVREIFDYIRVCDIVEYCDLIDGLNDDCMYDHADLAANRTISFKGYIDSRRNKRKSVMPADLDEEAPDE